MTPTYLITANGIDITRDLRGRLSSLSLVDADGDSADTLQITLVDSPNLETPTVGAELHVSIGYKESGLADMGLFISDSVKTMGPPDKVEIGASAAVFAQSTSYQRLQDKKTRSWEPGTLGNIAKTIAGEHGLAPKFSAGAEAIELPHIDQTAESDISFLKRVADTHDIMVKVSYGLLTLAPKGNSITSSGQNLPTIRLRISDLSSYGTTQKEKVTYDSVKAYYRDVDSSETVEVVAGNGSHQTEIRDLQPDRNTANKAARTALAKYQRKGLSGNITLPGRTDITSGSPIEIVNGKKPLKGSWTASKVTHNFTDGGWSITVDLESNQ
jgi:hypothetical protein